MKKDWGALHALSSIPSDLARPTIPGLGKRTDGNETISESCTSQSAAVCLDSEQGMRAFLASGLEYELLLCQELTSARVPFWSEADLRLQGLHKTPDARLKAGGIFKACVSHPNSILGADP